LLALTWFSVARKKQVDKDKASKTTSSFLCSVLPADDFDISEVVGALLAEFACQCEAQPVANGECTHVQQLCHSMRTEWPVPEPARTAHALCCLLAPREDCQTLKDVCVEGFDMLAGVIDLATLEGKSEVDARTLRPKPQKRNRIDEPWKLAAINDSIKFKRAKSGRAYLRADGTGDPAIASKWEAQHMQHYLTACARVMNESRQIYMAYDCARVEDPPEETLLTMVWSPQGDVAAVPPRRQRIAPQR